ncbi:MAG TPA: hypothetical protein VJ739_03000 [Gemmataceae bacterium]|nr:hypothetical protein [Gemmataceae bacterium]
MTGLPKLDSRTGEDLFKLPTTAGLDVQQPPAIDPTAEVRFEDVVPKARAAKQASWAGDGQVRGVELAQELRDSCVALARRARDAFKDACSAGMPDEVEASFASAKGLIQELWEFAYLRDRPFRDLLGLLDAALKRAELSELSDCQRDVLRQAFADLPRWMLDEGTVEGHVDRFAEHGVDIIGPLRIATGKKVRVTFEVVDE